MAKLTDTQDVEVKALSDRLVDQLVRKTVKTDMSRQGQAARSTFLLKRQARNEIFTSFVTVEGQTKTTGFQLAETKRAFGTSCGCGTSPPLNKTGATPNMWRYFRCVPAENNEDLLIQQDQDVDPVLL